MKKIINFVVICLSTYGILFLLNAALGGVLPKLCDRQLLICEVILVPLITLFSFLILNRAGIFSTWLRRIIFIVAAIVTINALFVLCGVFRYDTIAEYVSRFAVTSGVTAAVELIVFLTLDAIEKNDIRKINKALEKKKRNK